MISNTLTENSVLIQGVRIDNVSMDEAVKEIIGLTQESGKYQVSTPNMDFLYNASKNQHFKEILNTCILNVPDGKPLVLLSKLRRTPLKEKVSGADLFVNICRESLEKGVKIFLMGSAPGIAVQAKESLERKYPGLKIVGAVSPSFGFEKNEHETLGLIKLINETKPDILFVGVGSPKQEFWIHKNLNELEIKVAIGVGASFDFEAGLVNIPPPFVKKIGFAWLWRLVLEPKRLWRRYILNNLPLFFVLALKSFIRRDV